MRWLVALALLLAGLWAPAQAQPMEHVRDFVARIAVQQDGAVEVEEEIEVLALGHGIKRGIYRDLLLSAPDALGLLRPEFVLHAATRDGRAEPHRVERTGSGVRIWLGQADVFLQPGTYRYRLRYRMGAQVARHDGFDEIYWNVNGTGWNMPVLRVSAEIVVPAGATVMQASAYTGLEGEQGADVREARPGEGRIAFETTRPLAAWENLTVAVGFTPGIVVFADSAPWQRAVRLLTGTGPVALGLGLVAMLTAYYLVVWWFVGRDPPAGVVVPVWAPDLPPAAMRYIRRMRFDDQCVAAALLSLAVKGYVTFRERGDGTLVLYREVPPEDAPACSAGETALLNAVLGSRHNLVLEQANHRTLAAGRRALEEHFEATLNRVFFRRNGGWFTIGMVFTVLGWVAVTIGHPDMVLSVAGAAWLALAAIPLSAAWRGVLAAWRGWRATRGALDGVGAVVGGAMVLGITAMAGMPALALGEELDPGTVAALAALGGVNLLFLWLLRAPTVVGRAALDEIEGTRQYLTVAEAERLRFHNPPDRTPRHFEALLPYAVALGVETGWTRQFADVLQRAGAPDASEYRPGWYHGSRFSGDRLSRLGGTLGASYAAAATSPSSSRGSSGSGGGGSSGGGGGGGGGGGLVEGGGSAVGAQDGHPEAHGVGRLWRRGAALGDAAADVVFRSGADVAFGDGAADIGVGGEVDLCVDLGGGAQAALEEAGLDEMRVQVADAALAVRFGDVVVGGEVEGLVEGLGGGDPAQDVEEQAGIDGDLGPSVEAFTRDAQGLKQDIDVGKIRRRRQAWLHAAVVHLAGGAASRRGALPPIRCNTLKSSDRYMAARQCLETS
jgi:uncharacterized membrane protein YgcG